jgi:hypothetical protein
MTRDIRKEAEDFLNQDKALIHQALEGDRSVLLRAAEILERAKERDAAIHGGEPGEVGSADTRGQTDDDQGGVQSMAVSDSQHSRMMADAQRGAVTCPKCNMTSHNPNDVEQGYCGNCHAYTSPVNPMMQAKRIVGESHDSTRDLVQTMREDAALGRVTGDPNVPRSVDEQP